MKPAAQPPFPASQTESASVRLLTLPEADLPADAVEVGRVADAWGVRGGFRVHAFSADPQALFAARQWFVQPAQQGAHHFSGTRCLPVSQVRSQGAAIVAVSPAVTDRDAAQALRGARIFVEREHFPPPQDGEFYWVDLIGCAVRNREDVSLGTVANLLSTGAQTVLVLGYTDDTGRERERMIPFVDAYIDQVDLPAKTIRADWQPDY